MKLGLYGGSFDPIHRGHVEPVREAAAELGLDRVVYLPTARPPHKAPRAVSASRRLAMVELALLPFPELEVSDFEARSGRVAYTVDSVRHFGDRDPAVSLHLLVGGDSLAALSTWREWREILARVVLVVLTRPGWSREEVPAEVVEALAGSEVRYVTNRPLAFSSREIRAALAAGEEPPDGALAPLVLDYVRKYDLYR